MQLWKRLRSGLASKLNCLRMALDFKGPPAHLDCQQPSMVVLPLPCLDRRHLRACPLQRSLVRLQPKTQAETFPASNSSSGAGCSNEFHKKKNCDVTLTLQGGSARINEDSNSHLDPAALLQEARHRRSSPTASPQLLSPPKEYSGQTF